MANIIPYHVVRVIMSIVSNKAVKRDKAAEQAIKKRQQARKMLERIKELESLIFECSTIGVSK